ncbi:MAG: RdgB/HAM1 family non-canonical purine NTP pyrophosphatase [Arenicellales bacterium]|jgi:XTP/dITP diphosphohydrolase|nr:RdgB/HAM1 family non-canonical purine NTP pyrophosphatase [Arenicellales bacterium]MDP6854613.1 RdgB/HAM1 family non-canonical purine NTP pyrophosphatase [Arenicellales bacterium]
MEIVLATDNAGKLGEISALLAGSGITFLAQGALDVPTVEETGHTFIENAILKARNAATYAARPALADDSGLEVDALGGAPGVRSARYAGNSASDTDNVARLLKELTDLPMAQRSARFQCVMAWLRHPDDPAPVICQGTWEGHIALAARGSNGFGYDPVFVVPGEGRTAAELEAGVKNRLSHRGLALRQMVACLHSHQ